MRKTRRWSLNLLIIMGTILIAVYLNFHAELKNFDIKNFPSKASIAPRKNNTLTQKLGHEVRILCWVMTTPKNHATKAAHVLKTWGKRCDRLLFVTSAADDELDTLVLDIEDNYDNLWGKTREAFQRIYEYYYDEADWFLKADDDTFVFVENLRYLLYPYAPEMPIFFGHNLKLQETVYMSGGAGYVLSKEALRRFVEIALKDEQKCRIANDDGVEDYEIGRCLKSVNVLAGDSRDAEHKHRFYLFTPTTALQSRYNRKDSWYFNLQYYHMLNGREALSKYMAAFHYVTPAEMLEYEFFAYNFQVFGLIEDDEAELPKKISFQKLVIPPSDNDRKPIKT